jgi:hypothetical protein
MLQRVKGKVLWCEKGRGLQFLWTAKDKEKRHATKKGFLFFAFVLSGFYGFMVLWFVFCLFGLWVWYGLEAHP